MKRLLAATADAMYAVVDSQQQCRQLLRESDQYRARSVDLLARMPEAISRLDPANQLELTAQLNALACLARMCDLEVQHESKPGWTQTGKQSGGTPWLDQAKRMAIFDAVATRSFVGAFQVSASAGRTTNHRCDNLLVTYLQLIVLGANRGPTDIQCQP